jgi:UDP-GlcNAc:undecaprenyl-phosphate GlcNAc-1-phosphate transferase
MLFLTAAQDHAAVVSSAFLFVGVPVADAAVAIVRRLRAGTALLHGDRGHVYDQLVDRGWSSRLSAGVCVAAQAVLTGVGIAIATLSGSVAVGVTVAVVVVVGAGTLLLFTSPRAWTPDH